MKKSIVILSFVIFSLLITPSVVFASWWNPFSWFEDENKIETSIEISTSTPIVVSEIEKEASWWNPLSWGKKETYIKQEVATTTEEINFKPEIDTSTKDKDIEVETQNIENEKNQLELETVKAKTEAEKYKLQAEQVRLEMEKLEQEKEAQTQTLIEEKEQSRKEEEQRKINEEVVSQEEMEKQRIEQEELEVKGTKVGGVILVDTVWTLENSPYIVINDIVIEKNITLTINPGVVIKFKKGNGKSNFGGFEILNRGGNIIAKGDSNNKIIFTSYESNPGIGSWGTIEIVSGGLVNFNNVEVKYASYGIVASNASNIIVSNSTFSNNGVGMFVTGPGIISNNIIENNNSGIIYCGVTYSVRDDGTFSYQGIRKMIVTHNIIRDNIGQGLINPYNAGVVIQDLVSEGFSLELSYNDIYNSGSGIKFTNSTRLESLSIKNNNIYKHNNYNIWFDRQGTEIIIPNNWWGTANIADIDSKMYGYKANPVDSLPKINYQPFATSEILEAGVQ